MPRIHAATSDGDRQDEKSTGQLIGNSNFLSGLTGFQAFAKALKLAGRYRHVGHPPHHGDMNQIPDNAERLKRIIELNDTIAVISHWL